MNTKSRIIKKKTNNLLRKKKRTLRQKYKYWQNGGSNGIPSETNRQPELPLITITSPINETVVNTTTKNNTHQNSGSNSGIFSNNANSGDGNSASISSSHSNNSALRANSPNSQSSTVNSSSNKENSSSKSNQNNNDLFITHEITDFKKEFERLFTPTRTPQEIILFYNANLLMGNRPKPIGRNFNNYKKFIIEEFGVNLDNAQNWKTTSLRKSGKNDKTAIMIGRDTFLNFLFGLYISKKLLQHIGRSILQECKRKEIRFILLDCQNYLPKIDDQNIYIKKASEKKDIGFLMFRQYMPGIKDRYSPLDEIKEIVTITEHSLLSQNRHIYIIDINCSRNCETDDFALILFGIELHKLGIKFIIYSYDNFKWVTNTYAEKIIK